MNINDKKLSMYLSSKTKENITEIESLNLDKMQILSFSSIYQWKNLSLLSMRNNSIKKIDFLLNFPNLFHLDLRNNPLDDYSLFNKCNSFGYLGISPPENYFLERKILKIKNLNVGVLHLRLQNNDNYYPFIMNNPNVMLINNNFVLFINKFHSNNQIKQTTKFTISFYTNSNYSTYSTNSNTFIPSSFEINNNNSNSYKDIYKQIEKAIVIKHNNKTLTNANVSKMIKHIQEYNMQMMKYIKKSFQSKKHNTYYIYNEERFLTIERSRLLLIADLYQHSLHLQRKSKLNTNQIIFDINYFKHEKISIQIPIMCVFSLYLYGVVSKMLFKTFIISFYEKNNIINNAYFSLGLLSNQIDIYLSTKTIFQIAYYYQLYLHFETITNTQQHINSCNINFDYNKYKNSLCNLKLIPYIQSIKSHKHLAECLFNANPGNDNNLCGNKKMFIKCNYINYFENELKIFNEVCYMIQFINDCVLYNQIEKALKEGEHAYQYQVFLEIKELMNIHIDNINVYKPSIVETIYNKNKLLNLQNKFYFVKDNIDNENDNSGSFIKNIMSYSYLQSLQQSHRSNSFTISVNKSNSNNDNKSSFNSYMSLYNNKKQLCLGSSICSYKKKRYRNNKNSFFATSMKLVRKPMVSFPLSSKGDKSSSVNLNNSNDFHNKSALLFKTKRLYLLNNNNNITNHNNNHFNRSMYVKSDKLINAKKKTMFMGVNNNNNCYDIQRTLFHQVDGGILQKRRTNSVIMFHKNNINDKMKYGVSSNLKGIIDKKGNN